MNQEGALWGQHEPGKDDATVYTCLHHDRLRPATKGKRRERKKKNGPCRSSLGSGYLFWFLGLSGHVLGYWSLGNYVLTSYNKGGSSTVNP